jgi:uncharacterized protein YodC (DUF2158 family)
MGAMNNEETKMEENEIKPGAIVVLKSGGPNMTVRHTGQPYAMLAPGASVALVDDLPPYRFKQPVTCTWFPPGHWYDLKTETFEACQLRVVVVAKESSRRAASVATDQIGDAAGSLAMAGTGPSFDPK